ncbi:MAG: MFS transporter [Lachnospiraceae bacterium]|nr:MFS transporter [Lachnospiraceae bacterium]
MNDPMLTSSLSMVGLIPTVISIVFLSGPSLRFFGKKKSIYVGAGAMIVGYVIRAAAGAAASVPMLIVGTVICSLATGPISVPVNVLAADAVDYGDYIQKVRIEGIGSSVVSFAQKISSGLAAGVVGWILQLTGYVANQTQTATASFGITLIFAYAPIIALLLTILILVVFYRYDKVEAEVRSYLEQKNDQEANPA